MNCNEIQSLLSAYLDGELSLAEEKAVKTHLKTCTACQKQLAHLSVLHKVLRETEAPSVPEGLADRVLAAAMAPALKKKAKVISLPRILSSWQTYSLAAACMLIFTVFYSRTPDHFSATQKTNLYIAEERPISVPATLPTMPLGPDTPMPSPVPSETPALSAILRPNNTPVNKPNEVTTESTAQPEVAAAEADASMPAMARHITAFPVFTDAAPQEDLMEEKIAAAPQNTPAPDRKTYTSSTTNAKAPAPTQKPAAKTYPTVGSLVKRSITFVVDDTSAEAVFQDAKSGGVNAVRSAFYANNISYSTRESVIEEYAGRYNTLANEANVLAQKIAEGNTGLSSQLKAKENEMQSLKDLCALPTLRIAYQ